MPIGDWPVEQHPIYGCWTWLKPLNSRGYGVVWSGRSSVMAHVAVWRAERGPEPAGLQPDHLCRNRACTQPVHIEWVTKSVNELRKLWRVRARMKVLPCGHEFERAGVLTRWGGKVCRACSFR